MVKAADTRKPHNFCVHRGVGLGCSALGRIVEARVDSVFVVVTNVVSEKPTQMLLVEHYHVLNEFALA